MASTESYLFKGRPLKYPTNISLRTSPNPGEDRKQVLVQNYNQIGPELEKVIRKNVDKEHLDFFWDDDDVIRVKIKADKAWKYSETIREEIPETYKIPETVFLPGIDEPEWKVRKRISCCADTNGRKEQIT